jgi:hypothetical protein
LPQSSVTLHPICHVERKSLFAAARDLTADDADGTDVMNRRKQSLKEAMRLKQQIKSMLNEHCVRLEKGFRLSHPSALGRLLLRRKWSEAQKMLLSQLHAGLVGARVRRQRLRHYMAQEILAEKELLRLTRLWGINLITLYGLIAAIGEIKRFASARKLSAV